MDLSSKDRAALKAQAHDLDAVLQVGKGGLSEGFVEEVEARLKRDRLVKIRLLKSSRAGHTSGDLGRELAERSHAELVEIRGNTVVLYRPKRGKRLPRLPPEEDEPKETGDLAG
jgi:RNA-binding protein